MSREFADVPAMLRALTPSYPVFCLRPHVIAEAARQHAGERAVRPHQMILPHHLVERARAQPVGQRAGAAGGRRRGH